MRIIDGIDVASRERIWLDDPAQIKRFNTDVRMTAPATVQRFLAEFEGSDENMTIILAAARTLNPGAQYVTVSMFVRALEATMASGDLVRKPAAPVVTPTPEPEVPRDRNGRPLTAAQVKWGEYQKFLNESSSAQIAERRRTDPGFRAFIQHNLRDEMDQPIDGDMRPTNPHLTPKAPSQAAMADAAMVEFANRYRTMSAADIRKSKRFDTNPLGANKFNDDEARAIELHLI